MWSRETDHGDVLKELPAVPQQELAAPHQYGVPCGASPRKSPFGSATDPFHFSFSTTYHALPGDDERTPDKAAGRRIEIRPSRFDCFDFSGNLRLVCLQLDFAGIA